MDLLIVVDMQNDFVDGVLGTPEAQAIVQKVRKRVEEWDGLVMFTADVHSHFNYSRSQEGKKNQRTLYRINAWGRNSRRTVFVQQY